MKRLYPECSFEIVNFDTKGDKILNVALQKIGDKGLFTKELEDALESHNIDLVVHSLKDMPCQELADALTICGVPAREDPSDALVMAKRWQGVKHSLADLDAHSVVGTSSLRRIAQLKAKYPTLKFETIRGNLQTRFAKLDDTLEPKFDAIILAAAGLKRMKYDDRITQILPAAVCMHAVSQGALGIECRRADVEMIAMINRLNDEDTLLRCIAERTFLAKLEGGCSAPIGVHSAIVDNKLTLDGLVLDLDGSRRIQDTFEMSLLAAGGSSSSNSSGSSSGSSSGNQHCCPVLAMMSKSDDAGDDRETEHRRQQLENHRKRKSHEADTGSKQEKEEEGEEEAVEHSTKKPKSDEETRALQRQFSFITDLTISEEKMIRAELCGLHLAEKLREKGADLLINEIKMQITKSA